MPGKRASNVDLSDYVPAAELAHSAGVSTETVAAYAKRRARHFCKALRHVQGRNYVHLAVAEAYLHRLGLERRAKRPQGWRTLKAVLVESGAGRSTFWRAFAIGELRVVLAGSRVCVHPEDATHFILGQKNLKPEPSWVMVAALRKELGRSKEALNQWVRRNRDSVEVRHFLHPTRNRPVPHIKEADAARYRTIVEGNSAKHIAHSYQGGTPSRNRVLAVLGRADQPLTRTELAAQLGTDDAHMVGVLTALCREGVLKRCGRGVAYHPYTYALNPNDDT